MGKKIILLVAVVSLAGGWLLNSPVPDGYENPWKLRLFFAPMKIVKIMMQLYDPMDVFVSLRSKKSADDVVPNFSVQTRDEIVDGVKVRFYFPEGLREAENPGIAFIHGGGFIIGNIEMYDLHCKYLSHETKTVVMSVEYRQPPEHLFPVPFEDCVTASKYFISNAEKYKVDAHRIAIMGDSAGGNLAAAVTLKLRDIAIQPQPKLQVLIYPLLQAIDFASPSYQEFGNHPLINSRGCATAFVVYCTGTSQHIDDVIANRHTTPAIKKATANTHLSHDLIPSEFKSTNYVPNKNDFGDQKVWDSFKDCFLNPYFSPSMAEDMSGLPESIVTTVGHDTLTSDGIWYVKKLERAGVMVTHHHYKAGFHGIQSFVVDSKNNIEARDIIYKATRERL